MSTDVMQPPQLSTGRLLLLGLSSVVLCVSYVVAVFAPFPLALAVTLYGRAKGILVGLAGVVATYGISRALQGDLTLLGFYLCVFLFGVVIAEIVRRGVAPVKGLVLFGLGFMLLVGGSFTAFLKSEGLTAQQFILLQLQKGAEKIDEQKKIFEEQGGKEALQALDVLNQPELLARQVVEAFPGYFIMGTFVMLWFNMFLLLKSRRLLLSGQDFPHTEKELLNFKVPFALVPLLALSLATVVWGEDLGIQNAELWGYTALKGLGVFYFFQGFGILSDLLNFLGMRGFFRSILVVVLIFSASYLIAAVGLFDNWFDFRKYFVKTKTED